MTARTLLIELDSDTAIKNSGLALFFLLFFAVRCPNTMWQSREQRERERECRREADDKDCNIHLLNHQHARPVRFALTLFPISLSIAVSSKEWESQRRSLSLQTTFLFRSHNNFFCLLWLQYFFFGSALLSPVESEFFSFLLLAFFYLYCYPLRIL